MKKICFVVSSPMSVNAFLLPHLRFLSRSYEVHLVVNSKIDSMPQIGGLPIYVTSVSIRRDVDFLADLSAMIFLYRFFRQNRFDLVSSFTPKAGALGMVASWLAGVPSRVHWFTGQVWATRRGLSRWVYRTADRLTATLATHALVDSNSQREFLLGEQILTTARSEVLCDGSVCGVDLERFQPNATSFYNVRKELGVPSEALILLYVGRLTVDKGLLDLVSAFSELVESKKNLWLLLVGPDEQNIESRIRAVARPSVESRLLNVGYSRHPERYMAAADIFCLPSYREGFGSSVIEAAGCGLPAVVSKIYGLVDAVSAGETGLLHPPGDISAIVAALDKLLSDHDLRRRMGANARKRVVEKFSQERLTTSLSSFYLRTLQKL